MMQWAQNAIEQQKYDVALDFLDEVITLSPTYAEGWNRRATLHFMMSNYSKSMSDIDHTLQPRAAPFRCAVRHGADPQEHPARRSWR